MSWECYILLAVFPHIGIQRLELFLIVCKNGIHLYLLLFFWIRHFDHIFCPWCIKRFKALLLMLIDHHWQFFNISDITSLFSTLFLFLMIFSYFLLLRLVSEKHCFCYSHTSSDFYATFLFPNKPDTYISEAAGIDALYILCRCVTVSNSEEKSERRGRIPIVFVTLTFTKIRFWKVWINLFSLQPNN